MAATAPELALDARWFDWREHVPRFRDPGGASLRRAARAAVLMPGVLALVSAVAPQPSLTTFAAFGVFSQLVFGDFGGSSRPRSAAYAGTTAVGVALITIGTLLSPTPWAAALGVAVGAFALQFAAIFGGYVAAAYFPLLLSLVLATAIQAPPDELPLRLAGWLFGGAVALLGGVLLWPRHEQVSLRKQAGASCASLAQLYAALFRTTHEEDDTQRARHAAQRALEDLRQAYRDTPHRPVGSTRTARAFAELVDELGRALNLAPPKPRLHNLLRETDLLAESIVEVLEASARVLRGQTPRPDLARLAQTRDDCQAALSAWAADHLRQGVSAGSVLASLEAERPLKVASLVVLELGANAILAAGLDLSERDAACIPGHVERGRGFAAGTRVVVQTLRTHLRPSSIWFRNSLRAGVALGVAVLVVDMLGVNHAFWAVLGTISVLRSNALATGRTALGAIVGTTLGIFPASLLLIPLGTQPMVLWTAFPPAAFVAAYAPSVIGFVAGQAAFTLLVVLLFNIIQPVGWTLGLVRLEDVLMGTGLSLVVGALFWPRGARGQLLTALGGLYTQEAAYVRTAFGRLHGESSKDQWRAARARAEDEAARTGEVFDQFVDDRAAKRLPPETWAALQAGGSHLLLAAESIERVAERDGPLSRCESAWPALAESVEAIVLQLRLLSASLEHGQAPSSNVDSAAVPEGNLRRATIDCLSAWGGAEEAAERASAMALVAARDWVHSLRVLLDHLTGPATAAVQLARLPWWR